MHGKITVGVEELATMLGRAPASIRMARCRSPESLPPAIRIPGQRRLVWLVDDVVEWLRKHREPTVESPGLSVSPRRRGRPRRPTSI